MKKTILVLTSIILSIFALILVLLLTSCTINPTKQKNTIMISADIALSTQEEFVKNSELILSGTITKITAQYFTNPDGTLMTEEDVPALNAWVTEYEMDISQVYKGNYEDDIIRIKVYNGEGMTPDQFLYGEDGNAIVVSELSPYYLEVGVPCVVGLYYFERDYLKDGECGYNITYDDQGYFTIDEDGKYSNHSIDAPRTIDIAQLPADVENYC
jgi:hypothetical protein